MLLFVLVLVVAAFIFINTSYGKKTVRNRVQAFLENKLQTKVRIGSVDYRLPKWIEIAGVYIEDQKKDTLLYGERLAVDLNMIKLIQGGVYIRKVELKNIQAHVNRTSSDSVFNYQFIMDAFAGKDPAANTVKDTAALELTLQQLLLDDVSLKFNDAYSGSYFSAGIKNVDLTMNKFQPDRFRFDIDKLNAGSLDFVMVSDKASTAAKIADSSTAVVYALLLNANEFNFKNVNVSVQDKITGMQYSNRLHYFGGRKLHVNLNDLELSIDSLRLDSSQIKFVAAKPPLVKSTDTITPAWKVIAKNVSLKNNQFQFDDNAMPAKEGLDVAHLFAKHISLNAQKVFYSLDSITALINQLTFKEKSGFNIDTAHVGILFTNNEIRASGLFVKTPQSLIQNNVQIKFDGLAHLTTHPQTTYVNAKLLNSVIAVNDLYTLLPFIKKSLPPEKFRNNKIRLNTELRGSLQQLYIPYLQMWGLSGTVINAKAILYNIADPKKLGYDITVFNSTIPKADLLKFIPQKNKDAIAKLPPVINIGTRLKGDMNKTLAWIDIKSNTLLFSGTAALKNISDPKRLGYNLVINKSRVEKKFITAMVDEKLLTTSIELPEVIIATGTLKGDMNNVSPNLKLGGSYGDIFAKGYVRNFKNQEAATYDLQMRTSNFALGKLLKQDTLLGNITLSATAKGKGFNYKTMRSGIKGNIASVNLNKYNYKNIQVNALLNAGDIESNGSVNDSSLQMQYTATANVSGQYPKVEATIAVDTIQLKNLNLYKDTLNLSLNAIIKANNLEPRNLDVYALIDSGRVFIKNKNYRIDSIVAKGVSVNGVNDISLQSPFVDATATGAFDYDKIGSSLLQYINHYYTINDSAFKKNDNTVQQIVFNGVIKKHPLVTDLVPGLTTYENITIKGNYASQLGDSALQLSINTPYIEYQTDNVSNGKLDIGAANDQLKYSADFENLQFGSNILYSTSLRGNIANDTISLIAATNDQKKVTRYIIGGTLLAKEKNFSFSLSDSLLLNYEKWNVAPNNHIGYSPQGMLVTNFLLSNDSAKISAASQQDIPNSPIDITIQNFDIRDITSALNNDTLMASGLIDAKIMVSEFDKKLPAFTGTASIRKLEVMQQPVGYLQLSTRKVDDNTIRATLDLTENGNQVNAKGDYFLNNEQQQFDASLDIKKLQMATLQGFTKGSMSRASGSLNGVIALKGKFVQPEWKGELNFDTVKFTLTQFATTYNMDKQKISLDYPAITFKQFTIRDSLAHPFIIDGNLRATTLTEYDLDLDLNSRDFILINAPKAINNQVYGYAGIDANVSITGNTISPTVEGDIYLNDKSDITLVLPEKNIDKDAAKPVVRFIDRDTFALPELVAFKPEVEPKVAFAQFLNYNLNIQVGKQAALTIIIDPSTGDELKVQGDAQLNAGVEPGGNIVIAGTYLLNSGYYVLNYQFLKKRFNLLQGSTIYFGGPPLDAQINIRAEYIANTSPKDLLGNEVGSIDPRIANSFKQKIPFRVILFLKGSLKKTDISFDIQLPEEGAIGSELRTTIENKLVQLRGDAASTNKQVFALLALGRFVGEQSTDFFKGNSNGGGFSSIARESVSKFLSAALDQIASDLFKGINVDLNLNSYQDFTTSDGTQKTDLNVEVSKNFLNDRLSVTVGKNFGIEGQDGSAKAAQQKGSRFLPDVTVNYKLSTDGKYMVRAYNKNQFEVILDGYVVETGLAFIVTMDYDKFKELFMKKKKEDQ